MFKLTQEKFWAGTSASYWSALEAVERAEEKLASTELASKSRISEYVDELVGPMMSVEGQVAHIQVKGSLINGSAGFGRLYGVTGYDDIHQALTDAVADKNVRSILLNVDSGGGQVAGCQELCNYIAEVSKIKPVFSHTSTGMMSAAYWIGGSARKVYASETAMVGSIGVLIIHQEVSKAMAEAGITTTLVRSGKYKALANRYEPLSETAKEELQAQVDELDRIFVSHVAEHRQVSVEVVRKKMAQGREFLGQQAMEAGLVDDILSYSDAHSLADAAASKSQNLQKPVARGHAESHNLIQVQQGTTMKLNLTAEQLAALAAGAPVSSLGLSNEDAQALTESMQAAEGKLNGEGEAASESATATTEETKPKADSNDQIVSFLRGELRDANSALASSNQKIQDLESERDGYTAERAELLKIAKASIGKMQVALGMSDSTAAMADSAVVAEHTKLSEAFSNKFKVNGVAAVKPEAKKEDKAPAIRPEFAAAMALAKASKIV